MLMVFLVQVVILAVLWRLWFKVDEVEKSESVSRQILNRMVLNQRMFVPVIDKIANVAQDLWESRETRTKVLESHEAQEASLERIEEQLTKFR